MLFLKTGLAWVLHKSFQTGIFILIILIIRRVLKDRINSSFLNLLWILIIINLILPFSFKSSLSVYNIVEKESVETILLEPLLDREVDETLQIPEPIDETSKLENEEKINRKVVISTKGLAWENLLGIVWGVGVLIISSIILYLMDKFRKEKFSFKEVKEENIIRVLEKYKKSLNIKKSIKIYTSSKRTGPFIYGIFNPYIYIPEEILEELTLKDIEYVLAHELSHYKKGDIIINSLQILALTIHWFNPLVWIGSKAMKEDREIACDIYAINLFSKEDRVSYGETLLKFVILDRSSKDILYPVCFKGGESQMKKRISRVLNYERPGFIKKSLLVILALVLGIFLMTGKKDVDKVQGNKKNIGEEDSVIKIEGYIVPSKYFYTLERALDFVNFVPQLPKDKKYEVFPIVLREDENGKENSQELEIILADKENKKGLILRTSERNIIPDDNLRLTKDKNIAGIKGKRNASGNVKKFYWERKGIYYILEHDLEDEELEKTLKSFSDLSQREIKEIKNPWSEDKVNIYRDKDFEKAIDILGFTPKIIEKVEGYELGRARVDINHSMENSKHYYMADYNEKIQNMGMAIELSRELDGRIRDKIESIEIEGEEIQSYENELSPGEYLYGYMWEEDDLFIEVTFTGNSGSEGFKNADEEYRERVIKRILEEMDKD